MNTAIATHDLTKRYGSLTALNSVNLSVERGELFGLIGPDGAGKSSLYRILATLARPDGGSATVVGHDVVRDYRTLRRVIGYMPERFSLYPDMTVSENLAFFASLFGVTVESNFDLIAPIYSQLQRFPNRMAGRLSGGMKQKLALSCAMIHRPELLLLDEPTTGVDAVSRSEFWDTLADLRKQGITILVSTSYMDEATCCDRVSIIDHGRILRTGTPAELTDEVSRNICSAVATDMFGLLSRLSREPSIVDSYTFGSTLHIVVKPDFDPEATCTRLRGEGFADVRIYPAKGNIEDLFIKLTSNDRQE